MRYIKGLPNLVAYWPMDEASGSTMTNQAPANKGALNGTITGPVLGGAGKVGKAYSFDGSGDRIALGTDSRLNLQSFTFFCFFYLNTVHQNGSARKELIKRDTPFIFDLHANGYLEYAIHNGSYQGSSTNKVSWAANTWWMVHLTNVAGGGANTKNIYVNGVLDKAATGVTPTTSASSMFLGAADASGATCFNGLLQHCGWLSRALTTAEMLRMGQIAGIL